MGLGVVPGSCLTSLSLFLLVIECSIRVVGKTKGKKTIAMLCTYLVSNISFKRRFII